MKMKIQSFSKDYEKTRRNGRKKFNSSKRKTLSLLIKVLDSVKFCSISKLTQTVLKLYLTKGLIIGENIPVKP